MSDKKAFVCIIRATRPGFITEEPYPEEMAIMGEHFEYLKELLAAGKLVLAGPALDRSFGLSIFLADTEEEAREMAENDPSFKKGIMSYTLHPYHLSLLVGRD